MKIIAFSDFHGNLAAFVSAASIVAKEKPDKTVLCGDLLGGINDQPEQIKQILQEMDTTLYLIRGNNDRPVHEQLLGVGLEDNFVTYAFGRTLFFTHGDRYNAYRMPPVLLRQGDVLIHGHTHIGFIRNVGGVLVANVGSMGQPRDGVKSYLVLDERGVCLKDETGATLQKVAYLSQSGD